MAPPRKNTIEHFTHPGHQLAELNADIQYVCHVCKTPGSGKRYRCDRGCDVHLHEYCGTCPKSLSSFVHPHVLNRVMKKAQGNSSNHVCNLCRNIAEGLFYRCKECDFDVHPLCTQLPEILRLVLNTGNSGSERRLRTSEMEPLRETIVEHFSHPGHKLVEFNADTPYLCNVCETPGWGIRYRCDRGCDFNLHEYCGTSPKNLFVFMHPHLLYLVKRKTQGDSDQNSRVCDMCCNNVKGMFYHCEVCDFDVHPLCTQLPEISRHVLNTENSSSEGRLSTREMASPGTNAIEHFTHPGHHLMEFNSDIHYLCHVCKTPGEGKRYRCDHGCDIDFHEYCGTCPKTLTSFIHSHQLRLVMHNAQGNSQRNRVCNVCRDNIAGLFYRCTHCDFDVHPLCTQLPQTVRHELHPTHLLQLEALSSFSLCAVCEGRCNSWRYKCGQCEFDIHMECVLIVQEPTTQHEPEHFVPPSAPPLYNAYEQPFLDGFSHGSHSYNSEQPHLIVRSPGLAGQLNSGILSDLIFGEDSSSSFSS